MLNARAPFVSKVFWLPLLLAVASSSSAAPVRSLAATPPVVISTVTILSPVSRDSQEVVPGELAALVTVAPGLLPLRPDQASLHLEALCSGDSDGSSVQLDGVIDAVSLKSGQTMPVAVPLRWDGRSTAGATLRAQTFSCDVQAVFARRTGAPLSVSSSSFSLAGWEIVEHEAVTAVPLDAATGGSETEATTTDDVVLTQSIESGLSPASLIIPTGTTVQAGESSSGLPSELALSLDQVPDSALPSGDLGAVTVGPTLDVGLGNVVFPDTPAQLVVPYNKLAGKSVQLLTWRPETGWLRCGLPGDASALDTVGCVMDKVDDSSGLVYARTRHFSYWTVSIDNAEWCYDFSLSPVSRMVTPSSGPHTTTLTMTRKKDGCRSGSSTEPVYSSTWASQLAEWKDDSIGTATLPLGTWSADNTNSRWVHSLPATSVPTTEGSKTIRYSLQVKEVTGLGRATISDTPTSCGSDVGADSRYFYDCQTLTVSNTVTCTDTTGGCNQWDFGRWDTSSYGP